MDVPSWQMKAARAAYEAYCEYTGGKSLVTGDKLPTWDTLPGQICNAWHAAIMAIMAGIKIGAPVFFNDTSGDLLTVEISRREIMELPIETRRRIMAKMTDKLIQG